MPKIMDIIAQEPGVKSYKTHKFSYDTNGEQLLEYDDDTKIAKWPSNAETEKQTGYIPLKEKADEYRLLGMPSVFAYFMDGSRHIYKVDDISINKKVYPVLAGQIGVGCCVRTNGRLKEELFYQRYAMALPKNLDTDGWDLEGNFEGRRLKLNHQISGNRFKIQFDRLIPYEMPQSTLKGSVEDVGIARIQDYMLESEKEMVATLVKKRKLNQDRYLLKDGSLEYRTIKTDSDDYRSLAKIKGNYEYVVGVSKSFNPIGLLDQAGKQNANYVADLPLYHRTPAGLYQQSSGDDMVNFAVWFIRIRDKSKTNSPFSGILKVEMLITDDELCKRSTDEIDMISASLINERTPTCYGRDSRWANHLYPVFLTESYIKSKFLSSDLFLQLF